MPKELHDQLHKRAIELGYDPDSDEYKRYVYGTLQKVEKQRKEKEGSSEGEVEKSPYD